MRPLNGGPRLMTTAIAILMLLTLGWLAKLTEC